jgi:hypothetical protein
MGETDGYCVESIVGSREGVAAPPQPRIIGCDALPFPAKPRRSVIPAEGGADSRSTKKGAPASWADEAKRETAWRKDARTGRVGNRPRLTCWFSARPQTTLSDHICGLRSFVGSGGLPPMVESSSACTILCPIQAGNPSARRSTLPICLTGIGPARADGDRGRPHPQLWSTGGVRCAKTRTCRNACCATDRGANSATS